MAGFNRSSYIEDNPARRQYVAGGITWTVPHDAAFDMLAIFKRHGLKALTDAAIQEVVLLKGKQVFRELAEAIILDPPICKTVEEAVEKGGLTSAELNPKHLNQLVGMLMADWEVDGAAEAATFPRDRTGHRAGPTGADVSETAPPVAD